MAGISPAKRQQISALAANLNANGATGRAERAHIAHPLLSQPVVEMCLAIPAPVLSAGERERSFARETFADRLPQEIVERRSKGDISVFLNRTLAASCGFLRPFLLDGQLAARGLIDVAEFDRALEPEAIVWKDASREILSAAALEAWVRHWEGRISKAGGSGDPEGDAAPVAEAGPKASARKAKAR
jgi:asparagine synthase (glutamine-hydrolysing)